MRNTDLTTILFPVGYREVFFEEAEGAAARRVRIPGVRAVVNLSSRHVFCLVGPDHRLFTNAEALELGREAAGRLLGAPAGEVVVFNVVAPATGSFCHIDLVYPGRVLEGCGAVYLPFLRVTNSYTHVRGLRFDLGFADADSGAAVVVSESVARYRAPRGARRTAPTPDALETMPDAVARAERSFAANLVALRECPAARGFALPLVCKALDLNFNVDAPNPKTRDAAEEKRREFVRRVAPTIDFNFEAFEGTALAAFRSIAEYASTLDGKTVTAVSIGGLQRKAGAWAAEFGEAAAQADFEMTDYLGASMRYFYYSELPAARDAAVASSAD